MAESKQLAAGFTRILSDDLVTPLIKEIIIYPDQNSPASLEKEAHINIKFIIPIPDPATSAAKPASLYVEALTSPFIEATYRGFRWRTSLKTKNQS